MTLLIGLTGSIGMGKSATAAKFAALGVPVFDADAAVHALYAGAAVGPVGAAFPGTVVAGAIDRKALGAAVLGRPEALQRLEAIVHPLVRAAETGFISRCVQQRQRFALLDIPLLFESGETGRCDLVAVVSAPAPVQKQRVLAREGMTEAKFAAILARQLPDADKRRRAHAVIDTGDGHEAAAAQVRDLIRALAGCPGRIAAERMAADA